MATQCENLQNCGFFKNYRFNSEVVREGWIRMYCDEMDKSEKCLRKIYKREHGAPPPDNMAPTGRMLPI